MIRYILLLLLVPSLCFSQTTHKKGAIIENGIRVDSIYQRLLEPAFIGHGSIYDNLPSPWYPYERFSFKGLDYTYFTGHDFDNTVNNSLPDTTFEFIRYSPIPPSQNLRGKKGGLFLRIDDPFLSAHDTLNLDEYLQEYIYAVELCDKFNVREMWCIVDQYPLLGSETVASVSYPEFRRRYLRILADLGHDISSHSPNHSTNYYETPFNDLSYEDSVLIADGYDSDDGVDTIIINNSDASITIGYWKHLPDERYIEGGYLPTDDWDEEMDSIWYKRKMMANSVYVSIYPNRWGFAKLVKESQRRFLLNGLPRFRFWTHPGQEQIAGYSLDSIWEGSGYIVPVTGKDSAFYHVEDTLSSSWYPTVPTYAGERRMRISGVNYNIEAVDSVSAIKYKCHLTGFTGGSDTVTDVKLLWNRDADWMWWIHPDTIIPIADELGLIGTNSYPMGRRYDFTGYTASERNKKRFQHAHQRVQFRYYDAGFDADSIIEIICRAAARHYFVCGNDHAGYEDYYQRDSIYSFVNKNKDNIKFMSNVDMVRSVYLTEQNPYENILSNFDLDVNEDGLSDGWDTAGTPTKVTSVDLNGDTWSYRMTATDSVYCEDLWGVEKGINEFVIYARDPDSDAPSLDITVVEFYNRTDRAVSNTVNATNTYNIAGLSPTYTIETIDIPILSTTDWIDISISVSAGDVDISAPRMKLKY